MCSGAARQSTTQEEVWGRRAEGRTKWSIHHFRIIKRLAWDAERASEILQIRLTCVKFVWRCFGHLSRVFAKLSNFSNFHRHRFQTFSDHYHFISFLIFQRERQFIHDRNEPPYRSLLCISLLLGWAAQSHCTFAEIYVLFCLISCTRTLLYNNIVRTINRGVHTYLLSAMTLAVPTISNTSYFSDWSTHTIFIYFLTLFLKGPYIL